MKFTTIDLPLSCTENCHSETEKERQGCHLLMSAITTPFVKLSVMVIGTEGRGGVGVGWWGGGGEWER